MVVAGVLAVRRGEDGTAELDEALRLAIHYDDPDLVLVAAARAETADVDPAETLHRLRCGSRDLCLVADVADDRQRTAARRL